MKTPLGFRFAGIEAGIKPSRKDVALVASDAPCATAAVFTQNKAAAAPVVVAREQLPSDAVRAVLVNSGNANALTGPQGVEDVRALIAAVGSALDVPPSSVLTASTGVIGHRLPVPKIVAALPRLVESLGADAHRAAEAILTTDTRVKVATRSIELGGREATLTAIGKGSGMIAPELATVIAVVATDAAISVPALQGALREAVAGTFNSLVIDGDMSTNDAVFVLANGRAGNARIEGPGADLAVFSAALTDICRQLAKDVAADGEGATKLLEVTASGALSDEVALDLAKAVAGGSLVKAAIFGADPNWGRVLAAVGARCGTKGYAFDAAAAKVTIQDVLVYDGAPQAFDAMVLKSRMRAPEVKIDVALGAGPGRATAWGCDLGYDYVKINADYTSLIVQTPDGGVAKDDRLANYSPKFKASLLVEALSYISRFTGKTCVIKYGGAAMVKDSLKKSFCDDIGLLRSAGLKPVIVHGGGPEITRTLEKLGGKAEFIDGIRVTNASDLKVVEMVLTGSINTELVAMLNREGNHAVGVSGKDGGLLRARKLLNEDGRDLGQVGEIVRVNNQFLEMLLSQGYTPVISPIAIGEDGQSYNINADAVAAEVAAALKAHKLIYLSDVAGLLKAGELVEQATAKDLLAQIADGTISGGMKVKVRSILKAIGSGVERVHLIDGRAPHSIIAELFTDKGVGTLVTA